MIGLFLVGIIAGVIESSAGGSGLISLPAIIYLGYQPIEAVATSKFQYAFGALTAIQRFTGAGLVHWQKLMPMVFGAVVAGATGALVLSNADSNFLSVVMPIFLLIAAFYFAFSPRVSDEVAPAKVSHRTFGIFIVPLIAFYDGLFGVGSASLYVTAFIYLLGMNIKSATANTKLIDLASGIAALTVLALKGHVLLLPGLALGVGQIIGSYFGATLVIRWGVRWVKPLLVIVTIALSADLLIRNSDLLERVFQNWLNKPKLII